MARICLSTFVAVALLAPHASAGDAAGRLESISVVRGGAGASLAVRTSAIAVLAAATSINTRTVVIELVGIVADSRDVPVADAAGMISRIAIDTVRPPKGGVVTRIRVSLAEPCRYRLRTSGHVTYVDFERGVGVESLEVRRRPERNVKPGTIATAKTAADTRRAAATYSSTDETPRAAPRGELNLLAHWAAVTQPLQHTSEASPSATVLDGVWIPIVFKDGKTLFSHGEYAELDGHLAFFLPFDDTPDTTRVEPVTVPLSAIDLGATARAAESVRAARYAAGRGPQDFAALTESVSAILNAVPSEPDPVARVRLVEGVKRRLVEWPAAHHGYRAGDINEAISILDPILNQLRAAAGMNGVELSLAALTPAPPRAAFRPPTLIELLENAMRFALLSAPTLRMTVLRATAESLERHRARLPAVWLAAGQRRIAAALKSEARLDDAYRKLTTGIMERAERAVRNGNVRAIAALQSELLARDEELGRRRQEMVASTMMVLQIQFDVTAREQLRRERDAIDRSLPPPSRR